MSSLSCACGNEISHVSCPDPNWADLVTERDADVPPGEAPRRRNVFECPDCGRLWVQAEPRSDAYLEYRPEGRLLHLREDP